MALIPLYTKSDIRQMDALMIKHRVDSGYRLMCQAAQAFITCLYEYYPDFERILIVCGQGNNAGDGYVIARLLSEKKIQVDVFPLANPTVLQADAARAWQDWISSGGDCCAQLPTRLDKYDLLVDAILGTGLDRALSPEWIDCIETINHAPCLRVAVDIPSGLDADTGIIHGACIQADRTISFIASKCGMYTGQARQYCGQITLCALQLPDSIRAQFTPRAFLDHGLSLEHVFVSRPQTINKYEAGKVLIVGGNQSMPGAVILSALAALRSGAGMVKILTHPAHAAMIPIQYPEIICEGIAARQDISESLAWANVVVVGPGLGQDDWAMDILDQILLLNKPVVIDADALNLLSRSPQPLKHALLTPHAAEAGRLLQQHVQKIEADRFEAVLKLCATYTCHALLKGAGTLISDGHHIHISPYGNPGMASAGMGDSLSGIIAAFLAQGCQPMAALVRAANIHARAGDLAASDGQRGLIATDLLPCIRQLIG